MTVTSDKNRSVHDIDSSDLLVLIYDGECNLCDFWVRFLLRSRYVDQFRFSPRHSEFALDLFESNQTALDAGLFEIDSVAVAYQGNIYFKSEAILRVLEKIGWERSVRLIRPVLPVRFLDFFYDIVAKTRIFFWGRKKKCQLLCAEEKRYFIIKKQ